MDHPLAPVNLDDLSFSALVCASNNHDLVIFPYGNRAYLKIDGTANYTLSQEKLKKASVLYKSAPQFKRCNAFVLYRVPSQSAARWNAMRMPGKINYASRNKIKAYIVLVLKFRRKGSTHKNAAFTRWRTKMRLPRLAPGAAHTYTR